jgi:hypothetical protein
MPIDERLERLTERHEALTQTVDLIAAMQLANDKQIAEVLAASKQDGEIIRALAHSRNSLTPPHRPGKPTD